MYDDRDICAEWFKAYVALGGKRNREDYDSLNQLFYDICSPSYVYGEWDADDDSPHVGESRQQAFNRFIKTAKISRKEALRVFNSVDSVTAFS